MHVTNFGNTRGVGSLLPLPPNGPCACAVPAGEGGLSRLAQYQRYLTADVETIRMLYQYRTPMMLRYGCCVLIHVFALLLAPYFASFCSTWSRNDWNSCPAGYIAAILFVATSMLMYSIQKGLEQPFDMQVRLGIVVFMQLLGCSFERACLEAQRSAPQAHAVAPS